MTAPKMTFAFESAADVTTSAASLTSNSPSSEPPVMLSRMPVAPSTDCSSSGDETAVRAASAARFSPRGAADAHQRRAGVAHDRPHVGEVEVDDAGHGDQVGDALDALAEDVVGDPERLGHRRPLLDHLQQAVVLDHDQRVDAVAQVLDALLGLLRALAALERERLRDDADGQRLELAAELGDDRRAARAGAAALAGGDEDHVGALERLLQLVAALLRGREPDCRVGAGAEAAGRLRADVDLHVGVRHEERLRIRVHGDELDAAETGVDHAIDGVRAAAADADDLDRCDVVPAAVSHRRLSSSRHAGGLDLPLPEARVEHGSCQNVASAFRVRILLRACQRNSQGEVESEDSTST